MPIVRPRRPLWHLCPAFAAFGLWACNSLTGVDDLDVSGAPGGRGPGGESGVEGASGVDGGTQGRAGVAGNAGRPGNAGRAGRGGEAGGPAGAPTGGQAGGPSPLLCEGEAACVDCCVDGVDPLLGNLGRDFIRDCFCEPLDGAVAADVNCSSLGGPCEVCCDAFCNGGGSDDPTLIAGCLACAEVGGGGGACQNLGAYCGAPDNASCGEIQACVEDQCRTFPPPPAARATP